MILTCPECATGYFVDDAQIKPGGRPVRCAACGARWTAYPPGPLELSSSPEEGAIAKEPAPEAEAAPLTGEDLPRAFRSRAEEGKRMRQAAVGGAIWAGGAVVLALTVGALIVFRESVVRAWPQSASAYAAVGLAVNPVGLVIEQVRPEPSLQDGHAVLIVSGVIRNVVDHAVVAPPLRISLMNAQGKRVAGEIASFANGKIPPGETRHFTATIVDPPFSAQNLQVDFAVGQTATASSSPASGPSASAPIALRGPSQDAPPSFSANAASPPELAPAPAANAAASNAAAQ